MLQEYFQAGGLVPGEGYSELGISPSFGLIQMGWPIHSSFSCQRDGSQHLQRNALAVAIEFRRVHALDFRDAGLVFAAQLDAGRILEHISALGQVIDEEMARGVA